VGFYTTAPGYRFGRNAYLAIIVAPLILIAPLGAVLCWSPLGEVLWFPLATHLGGCIGDLTIARHVARAPRDVQCEDLRDGVRFWLRAGTGVA
jgi:Putative zincin peptidase